MSPTMMAILRYMRQHDAGTVTLLNCYLNLAQALMFGMTLGQRRCTLPVIRGSLTYHDSLLIVARISIPGSRMIVPYYSLHHMVDTSTSHCYYSTTALM